MTELTLKSIFEIILRRIWLVVLLPACVVIVAAGLVFYVITPVYTASASMYVLNKQSSENITYSDLQSSTLLTADYRELVLSHRVLSVVAEEYGLVAEDMEEDFDITVTNENNSRIIVISVTSGDPVLAANLANSMGREFATVVVEIMDADNVNFVDLAVPPIEPSAPKKLITIAIAGVVALLLGIMIAILIEMLNTTIRTVDDVEKHLGLTVLARIPKIEVK